MDDSSWRRRSTVLLVGAVLLAGTGATSASAQADGATADAPSAVDAVNDVVASDAPSGTVLRPDAATAISAADLDNLTATKIPTDPSDGVSVGDMEYALTIGLPADAASSNAVVDDASVTAVYEDASTETDIAVQPTSDAGVRIMTVLSGPDAPTRFAYPMSLPEGTTLRATADGGAEVVTVDGLAAATIAPAWAKDANGDALPTYYEIEDSTLTQVVQHDERTAYPVVADPTVTRNCGIITCTWYISVLKTREMSNTMNRTASTIAGGLTAGMACLIISSPSGPGAAVAGAFCTVAAAIGGPLIQRTFNNARLSHDCVTLAVGARAPLGHVDYSNRYCYWS
jgi:hypothetical protein